MLDEPKFRAFNFDLDTAALRAYFGESGRSKAYAQIKSFLESHGFQHRQYSGYRSIKPLSESEALGILRIMYKELQWLPNCVNRFDITDVGQVYDAHAALRHEQIVPEQETEGKTPKQLSLNERINLAHEEADIEPDIPTPEINIDLSDNR